MYRLNMFFVASGVASIFFIACGFQSKKDDELVREVYGKQWQDFLRTIPKGTTLVDAKKKLEAGSQYFGIQYLGGSGDAKLIFQIDPMYELSLRINKDQVVVETPRMRRKGNWLRFPDGTVVEIEADHIKK